MNFDLNDALAGFAGGILIGLAAAFLLVMSGRIAGISGIAAGALRQTGPWAENAAFLVGLIGAPLIYAAVAGAPDIGIARSPIFLVGAGLLVGFGTRLGNGCTSGHGVCGMSRLSLRSIVATLSFMAVAIVVASFIMPAFGG